MVSNINFNEFPTEILEYTFSFVDVFKFGNCALVCKRWNQILQDWSLWKAVFFNKFTDLSIENTAESPREYINKRKVNSLDQMLIHLGNFFIKQLQPGQQGLFRCVFLFNPECDISVTCGRDLKEEISENSASKICFFSKALVIPKKDEIVSKCDAIKNDYDHFFQWRITLPQIQLNISDVYCDKVDRKILTCFSDSYLELTPQNNEKETTQAENKKTPSLKKRMLNFITRKK